MSKIGFREALNLIKTHTPLMPVEEVVLDDLCGRILGQDLTARVDSPSVNAALKDGYAVHSADLVGVDEDRAVVLLLGGHVYAGKVSGAPLPRGTAARVATGAALPPGADAVLAGEFAVEDGQAVRCIRDAGPGRNVLPRGADVQSGRTMARRGEKLHPALIGLLAAAGLDRAPVFRKPRVVVVGTGDEVVAPGHALGPGKLYASNMVEIAAWLRNFGIDEVRSVVAPDRRDDIKAAILSDWDRTDAFVSSGGAWGSEKDLMEGLLADLGWKKIFHRLRLGPGKAAGFGLIEHKPFFILPGGPPSSEAAFLLLALPGLLAMSGWNGEVFPRIKARLTDDVSGQAGWTQVVHAITTYQDGAFWAKPVKSASRLSSMARKNSLILISEDETGFPAGEEVEVRLLFGDSGLF
ncbi:MAG: gephyrin-like molybdotransferase Glp [Pseudomonadota bacterium]